MKPGPATSTDAIRSSARSFAAICLGEIARLGLGFLGQHHRGIGRHVAMRGIARRLDHDPRQIDAGGPAAFGRERAADRVHARQHIGEKMRWIEDLSAMAAA